MDLSIGYHHHDLCVRLESEDDGGASADCLFNKLEETTPQGKTTTTDEGVNFRLIPAKIPTKPEGTRYDRFHADPRLFFCGAPSSYDSDHPFAAAVLHEARKDVPKKKTERHVHIMPLGTWAIHREEKVRLKDGREYSLEATWVSKPRCRATKPHDTQTRRLDFPDF